MNANYVLSVRLAAGSRQNLLGEKAHDVKSVAGKLIHFDSVRSVYVGDNNGTPIFYMVKDANGHVMREKTINVPSAECAFG